MIFTAKSVGDISITPHAQERYYQRILNKENIENTNEIINKIENDIKDSYFSVYKEKDLGFYNPSRNIFFKFDASLYHTNDILVTDKHIKTVFTTSNSNIFKIGKVNNDLEIELLEEVSDNLRKGNNLKELIRE